MKKARQAGGYACLTGFLVVSSVAGGRGLFGGLH